MLTDAQIHQVTKLTTEGLKPATIAKRLGLTKQYVDDYLKSRMAV